MLRRPRAATGSDRRCAGTVTSRSTRSRARCSVAGARSTSRSCEFDVLDALSSRAPARLQPRARCSSASGAPDWFGDDHVVDVHVANVRRKLGDDPAAALHPHRARRRLPDGRRVIGVRDAPQPHREGARRAARGDRRGQRHAARRGPHGRAGALSPPHPRSAWGSYRPRRRRPSRRGVRRIRSSSRSPSPSPRPPRPPPLIGWLVAHHGSCGRLAHARGRRARASRTATTTRAYTWPARTSSPCSPRVQRDGTRPRDRRGTARACSPTSRTSCAPHWPRSRRISRRLADGVVGRDTRDVAGPPRRDRPPAPPDRGHRARLERRGAPARARRATGRRRRAAARRSRRGAPAFDAKGVELRVAVTAADRRTVRIDPDRAREVLAILLDNALRHTERGGLVTLSARRRRARRRARVEDNGDGLDADQLERVFERFYRVDPARDRATGGSGIGLTIARAIVEAHNGTINAQSPGSGHAQPSASRSPPSPSRARRRSERTPGAATSSGRRRKSPLSPTRRVSIPRPAER